ncbi:MAG: DUF547 domain-containing protein [Burkholderiales bacterium]|nr:DUF547 domain-containing protein [Burkholderiales bacterium]
MKRFFLLMLWAALPLTAPAQVFDHTHAAWGVLLEKHVVLIDGGKSSQARYAGFAQDRAALKTYLGILSKVSVQEFAGWSKPQQMAFLINAYNAYTIEKILTRYPDIRSIWDFGKLFGNPFKDRFFRLLGREFSLDMIEHDTLRKPGAYNEPRVHFAVNCASVGCPMLREEPYVAVRLDTQLEEQTQRFLADRSRNRYNAATNTLEVSEIFKWFGEDWTSGYRGFDSKGEAMRSLAQFFAKYANLLADAPDHRQAIAGHKAAIRHLEYDWTLNDSRK